MTKTGLFGVLFFSLCLFACGSSSSTNSVDAAANTNDVDATSPNATDTTLTNAIDVAPINATDVAPINAIDVAPINAIDAAPINAIDATPTSAVDAGPSASDIDGGPNNGCPNLAGAYILTTQIVSTTCKVGLNTVTQPITYTFKQAAPSCSFTMTASIYPSSTYSGHFVMAGGKAKVFWDSVAPAPTILSYALSYTAEDLAITPGTTVATSTIVGTFTWHSAADCDGTTNVCNGAIPAGCPTPK